MSIRLVLIIHLLFFPATLLAAAIDFDIKHDFGVEGYPRSIAIGDFNRDGKPDMAVTNTSNYNVSVLLGNGDGTFQTEVPYSVGSNPPLFVAIGDFDRDGKLDLAVAIDSFNGYVSILRGNGDGTFQAAESYAVAGEWPESVAIGDFNDDGKPDLAVANSGSYSVSILLGNGDCTFQAAKSFEVGDYANFVTIGDVNGDGKADLAVTNGNSDNVSILLGNGNGTFQPAINHDFQSPESVAIGEFNGDGKPDLAVTRYNPAYLGSNLSILQGNGDGTFQTTENYFAGDGTNYVAGGDLNNDGKLDLAVANELSYNVSVLRGNGNGTFQAPINYAAGSRPFSVAIGDFNRDGKPDLAAVNFQGNNVSVFLNKVNLPDWTENYPYAGLIDESTAEVLVSIDRDGDAYLVCLPKGANAPTSLQVRAGQNAACKSLDPDFADSATILADGSAVLSCNSLSPATSYDLYTVAADSEGSLQAFPTKLAVTTDLLSPLNDDTEFVKQVYRDFLNREAEQGGLDYWVGQLSTGARTRAEVVEQYMLSPEFGEKIAPVVRLYFAYFNRIPDYDGLMYWVYRKTQGTTLDEISDAFAGSPEFQQTYGSLNNAEFVMLVYQNVLGRDPDPEGFAYWTHELNTGHRTRGQVMTGFSESEEYKLRMDHEVYVTMTYVGLLRRSPEPGGFEYWVNRMDGGDSGQILIDGFLNSTEYAARFAL